MSKHYPPISREAQMDILAYCVMRAAGKEDADVSLLTKHIRYGSITWARVEMPGFISDDPNAPQWKEGDAPRVAFRIVRYKDGVAVGEHNPRYCDLEAFLMLLVLTMFGGHAFMDDTSPRDLDPDEQRYAYIEVHNPIGDRLHRLIAGAGRGEVAKLGRDHYDLRAQSLEVVRGNAFGTRESVIQAALVQYHAAINNEHPPILSAYAYEALVRFTFKLLDDNHGHKVKRWDRISEAEAAE